MTQKGPLRRIRNKNKLLIAMSLILLAYTIKCGTMELLNLIIRSQLEFEEGSYHFRMWRTNQYPYEVEFYFFNWTNSDQVRDPASKPRLEEVGPYRFELYINRTNIQIHHHNDSVTYSFTKRFIYIDPKKEKTEPDWNTNEFRVKGRGLDDVIITLNPIANALAYQARDWSTILKLGVSLALRATKSELYVKKTVRELLFEGYEDPLLDFVKKMPNFAMRGLGMDVKDKFGYFYKRNYTDLYFGPYNVHSKVDSFYGDLHTIKGSTSTPFFPGRCGRVHGKLGEYADPEHDHAQPVVVYVHDLNVYTENYYLEERLFNGVVGSVYAPRDYIFDNGTFEKSNKCFCSGECVPMGMLNSSATFSNAPIFMSLPHFLLADSIYQKSVDIIRSDNGHLMPYIAVEHQTGLLLDGALNIQLNMLLQPVKGLGMFSDVPKIFMPVFTMKQHVVPRGGYLELLVVLQKMVPMVINCLSVLALLAGVGMLLFVRMAHTDDRDLYREYRQVPTK